MDIENFEMDNYDSEKDIIDMWETENCKENSNEAI